MLRLLLVLFLMLGCIPAGAQDPGLGTGYESGTNLNVLYRSDFSFKAYATTRGFGLLFRRGRHVTAKTRSFYEADLQSLKHPKEVKSSGDADQRRRYVYGKLNSVLIARGSFGLQNVIFSKGDSKAVEVRYSYSVGPLIAFAKPYYVRIYKNNFVGTVNQSELIRFDSENFTQDSGRIMGRGPFTEGLPEMKFFPGVSGKFNLSFEYAPFTNLIRAIETGISLDYYPRALPLMLRNPNENFILTFHVGFVFGRKWF